MLLPNKSRVQTVPSQAGKGDKQHKEGKKAMTDNSHFLPQPCRDGRMAVKRLSRHLGLERLPELQQYLQTTMIWSDASNLWCFLLQWGNLHGQSSLAIPVPGINLFLSHFYSSNTKEAEQKSSGLIFSLCKSIYAGDLQLWEQSQLRKPSLLCTYSHNYVPWLINLPGSLGTYAFLEKVSIECCLSSGGVFPPTLHQQKYLP